MGVDFLSSSVLQLNFWWSSNFRDLHTYTWPEICHEHMQATDCTSNQPEDLVSSSIIYAWTHVGNRSALLFWTRHLDYTTQKLDCLIFPCTIKIYVAWTIKRNLLTTVFPIFQNKNIRNKASTIFIISRESQQLLPPILPATTCSILQYLKIVAIGKDEQLHKSYNSICCRNKSNEFLKRYNLVYETSISQKNSYIHCCTYYLQITQRYIDVFFFTRYCSLEEIRIGNIYMIN